MQSQEQVLDLMEKGQSKILLAYSIIENRAVGETNVNEQSSRSHSIFRIVSRILD